MEKRIIDIIEELRDLGHHVSYRRRRDGGINITSIDGVKYTSSEGNAVARHYVGAELSQARREANIKAAQTHKTKAQARQISADVQKQLRKTQKAWRQAFPNDSKNKGRRGQGTARTRKGKKAGRVSKERAAQNVKLFGPEETKNKLIQAERYAKGLAYDANVDNLIDTISEWAAKADVDASEIIDFIEANRNNLYEDMIADINEEVYKLPEGQSVAETLRQVKIIVNRGSVKDIGERLGSDANYWDQYK